MLQPGRNDPCLCGSGKKYKKCCRVLDDQRSARSGLARSSLTLRDKNLALLGAVSEIFGLGRPWDTVKHGMTDAKIREFYRFVAMLWPVDTDPRNVLPRPDTSLRALYLGENDPEMMLHNVFRFCLYADQILLVNPFENPNVMAEKYNPIVHPGEWRIQTLRRVYQLKLLAPWIEAGLVILIPDPGNFDRALRVKTWDSAEARLKGWMPSPEDTDESVMKERTQKSFLMMPRHDLERNVREVHPEMSDEEVLRLVEYMESERANDPLLPNDTLDRMPGQMMVANMGANLEMDVRLPRHRRFSLYQRKISVEGDTWRETRPRRYGSDMESAYKCVSTSKV
jgi:hypothetical protein